MFKIGIIGCGHWGKNHIRVFYQLPKVELIYADCNQEILQQ